MWIFLTYGSNFCRFQVSHRAGNSHTYEWMNIIDGLNGLSLGTAALIVISIAIIADITGTKIIFDFFNDFLAAMLGVFILNFPFGLIFIGDGGAYLIGGLISMLVIMLPTENPKSVSFRLFVAHNISSLRTIKDNV